MIHTIYHRWTVSNLWLKMVRCCSSSTVALLLILFGQTPLARATCAFSEKLSDSARTFMLNAGLIGPGDEIDDPLLKSRWQLAKAVESDRCLLVMTTCTSYGKPKATCDQLDLQIRSGDPFEVLVYDVTDDRIETFESVFPISNSIILETYAGYFVEVFSDSVAAAEKALKAGLQDIPGLYTYIVRGSPATYDPNVNRKWFSTGSRFSLRRGSTAETLDIYAADFERDLKGTFDGCMKVNLPEGQACAVAPWGGGLIKKIR